VDVHNKTAMDIFNVKEEEVTGEMRRTAKTVNFGIVYGMGDHGLSERLNIPVKEASAYIRQYFESYPRVKQFLDDCVEYCEKNGYVKTLLKRRREIPEIKSKDYQMRQFAQRAAKNAPVQGTAADLIKAAMNKNR